MKTFAEASSQAVERMETTLTEPANAALTVRHGSMPAAGSMTTPPPRLLHDQIVDLHSNLLPHLLSLIKREKSKDGMSVLKTLELLSVQIATKDEIVHWVTRLLAHFPGRDTTKDAIILADVAHELMEKKVKTIGVYAGCRELWMSSNEDKPFLPPTGEIYKTIEESSGLYERLLGRARQQYGDKR